MSRFLLLALLPLALAACSSTPREESILIDRVEMPPAAPTSSVLSPGRLLIEGAAAWETMTVGELMERRALTSVERERAARATASGAYLGDPTQVLRLTPANATAGPYQAGTAYLTGAFPPEAAPGPFSMVVTFGLTGEPGSTAGLSLELRDPAPQPTGRTGQLLITLMDPGVNTSAQLTVSVRGPGDDDAYEPVGSAPLASRDWRGTHRLSLAYIPGRLDVFLDDEPVVSTGVRLDRPVGPIYVGAFASTPTMGVTLLDWILP